MIKRCEQYEDYMKRKNGVDMCTWGYHKMQFKLQDCSLFMNIASCI